MRTNLLETYGRQIKVAEAYVNKNFGKSISANTQLTTAVLLDNTNRFMSSLNESVATMRSDLGDWKKFCLNLTNIAVPSLIANDLVIVHPMTSFSGSVAYLEYVALTNKGGISVGDRFNGVFGLDKMSDERVNYTSQSVVERCDFDGTNACKLVWGPVITNYEASTHADIKVTDLAGNVLVEGVNYVLVCDETAGTVAIKNNEGVAYSYKVAYKYNQEYTPAKDIPTIGPKMRRIALTAEPRRIAVKYDQITAFQAKTDYGFSLDKQIAEQACGELAYEIDTEIVDMLCEGAKYEESGAAKDIVTWDATQPIGISLFEHYNSFLKVVERIKAIFYRRTGKFHPNYMVVGAYVPEVLRFVNGFTPVKSPKMNGPYKIGELDGLDVYVSPRLEGDEFFFGLNGSDMMSSAGVYAPYMAIVPTQLLGTPDGALQQGFSTWYAKALLNRNLLVAGKITNLE